MPSCRPGRPFAQMTGGRCGRVHMSVHHFDEWRPRQPMPTLSIKSGIIDKIGRIGGGGDIASDGYIELVEKERSP